MAQLKDLIVAGDAQILGDLNANNFSGTDGTTAGKAGLVPAPATSDNNKYLKSDGTWAAVSSGSSDYTSLTNKPSINSTTLSGNKTSNDLNLQTKIYTDLTEDLYFVDGTAPTLATGMYYNAGYNVYINGTKQNPLTNNPFYFTADEVEVEEDQWETYYTLSCVIGTTLYSATCSTDNNLIWITKMDSVLKRTDIDTSIPSVSRDTRIPSTKLFTTQLATKQNTLSQGTNITISGNTISATDTKNTAGSTDTSSKIYLIGATSQAANPQTYSDNEVFVQDGVINTQEATIGTRIINSSIGTNSFAQGQNVEASGNFSHAEGQYTAASGDFSHAEGQSTIASENCSHAEGYHTTSSGWCSHAEGFKTIASGQNAHAEGIYTYASGMGSHAEGACPDDPDVYLGIIVLTGDANATTYTTTNTSNVKIGYYIRSPYDEEGAFVTGITANSSITLNRTLSTSAISNEEYYIYETTIASGEGSHAEGYGTIASGKCSHAGGWRSTASKDYSYAQGSGANATGQCSHAEGQGTTASANCSHAEGYQTTASGYESHAEGSNTTASGYYSHAEGYYTTAQRKSQHTQGEYNILDTSGTTSTRGTYAHIVGNGTSNSNRSNAHTLDWSGNAWYAGDVYVGSTSGTNKDSGSKKLATEEYVTTRGYVTTDTKNTAGSTDTSSKIYLVGATSQAANPQTYSDNEVFAENGALTAKKLTATSDGIYVNAGYIHGETNTTSTAYTNHAIKLGHANDDIVKFFEYGGIFEFYQSRSGTNTLLGTINSNGWDGKLGYITSTTTDPGAGSALDTGKIIMVYE